MSLTVWAWLTVAVILLAGEVLSPGMLMLPFGLGALAAADHQRGEHEHGLALDRLRSGIERAHDRTSALDGPQAEPLGHAHIRGQRQGCLWRLRGVALPTACAPSLASLRRPQRVALLDRAELPARLVCPHVPTIRPQREDERVPRPDGVTSANPPTPDPSTPSGLVNDHRRFCRRARRSDRWRLAAATRASLCR